MRNLRIPIVGGVIVAACLLGSTAQGVDSVESVRDTSIEILRAALADEQEWVKVHAAEFLVFNNYPAGVREAFEAELERGPAPKYRIGVWRVLAQAAGNDKAQRQKYVDLLVTAAEDPTAPDRLRAAEALVKLGHSEPPPGPGDDVAGSELPDDTASGSTDEEIALCVALAEDGGQSDRDTLIALLEDPDVDVRVHAANALLRIERREFRGLQWLDWIAIALYAAFMLGVGFYYSRRQTSTEEYFVASRSMNPTLVGISIFATLLSTISYLGYPGEMIKHGPVILSGMVCLPFVYLFAGYLLIPHILKVKVTSAYEILESRLGLSVRLLGSVIFILTRLVWMALLIYIAAKLMVEMLNWDHAMIPWVVIAAGIVAVAYTAMGGLRAVVVTDLFQFVILMGGALLTIGLISMKTGGFGWFPTEWAPHWDRQPLFSWNIGTRVTIVGSFVSLFMWWICTAGSDQVAIQRYLATRDLRAARRAFLVNCICDVVVTSVLGLVGFALLGFFALNPHMIPDGKSLIADADYLFPRFIANTLPLGVAGLVVAGMFAAAMSSLDSGINSIVTVVSQDFLGRRRGADSEGAAKGGVSAARYLVLAIGAAVVLLSSQVQKVPGNIVEVTNKTNGLFVGPLFGLFVMALFVRRSTAFGTVLGAVYGFMTAFAFAYWDMITGAPSSPSWQWIIASALMVHIASGCLLSRVPTQGKGPLGILLCGVLALVPLVVVYACLVKWGMAITTAMGWG